jgi:hypothetical protein
MNSLPQCSTPGKLGNRFNAIFPEKSSLRQVRIQVSHNPFSRKFNGELRPLGGEIAHLTSRQATDRYKIRA